MNTRTQSSPRRASAGGKRLPPTVLTPVPSPASFRASHQASLVPCVLIVEDDPVVLQALVSLAELMGIPQIHVAGTCLEARRIFDWLHGTRLFVLLEVGLADAAGWDLLRFLGMHPSTSTVVVTRDESRVTRLQSLELGADGFLTKPLNPDELFATVVSIARRLDFVRAGTPPEWVLDILKKSLTTPTDQSIQLTEVEVLLLEFLCLQKGHPVSRDQIGTELGGFFGFAGNALEAVVSRLRKKIVQVDSSVDIIKTVAGVGYILSDRVILSRKSVELRAIKS